MLEVLVHDLRSQQLDLETDCDSLRYEREQLVGLVDGLKAKMASCEHTILQLQEQLRRVQFENDAASQELLRKQLNEDRLQAQLRAATKYGEYVFHQSMWASWTACFGQ